jgi:molecular chaperone DnaK (HSP70)
MVRGSKAKYVVGIDLGTTNSAVAYANIASAKRHGGRSIKVLPIPQVVALGEVAEQDMLPSSLYLPNDHELRDGFRLPWSLTEAPQYLVGRYAQIQGAKIPGRLVNSAKSWLSYGGVDRTASILPWGATDEVPKVSPVDASARFLAHIVAAWHSAYPKAPLQNGSG